MPIITREKVKEILQITGTDKDTLIDTLIPSAEGAFLIIRGIPFFEAVGDVEGGSEVINNVADSYLRDLSIGARLSSANAYGFITDIDDVVGESGEASDANTVTLDLPATGTAEGDTLTVYPPGSEYAAAKIVGFYLNRDAGSGNKSERIGNYSYTKFESKTGIPQDIAGMIEGYARVHS